MTRHALLRRTAWALALGAVLVLSVWVRTLPYGTWKQRPKAFFFHSAPLPTTFDAPYYMRLARDLGESVYNHHDPFRKAPSGVPRPWPPPLLSVLGWLIHTSSSLPYQWIAAVLPVACGTITCIVLYILAAYWVGIGRWGATTAAALMAVSPYFYIRSSMGRFDTDCLNVAWCLLMIGFSVRYVDEAPPNRYAHLAALGISTGLFIWWWDQSPYTPLFVLALNLGYALPAVWVRDRSKEVKIVLCLLLFLLGVLFFWMGPERLFRIARQAFSQLSYVTKKTTDPWFPNIGLSISEQAGTNLKTLARLTTGNTATFFLALGACLAWMLQKTRWIAAFCPLVFFSILGIFFAQRFLIFFVPLLALGLGWLVSSAPERFFSQNPKLRKAAIVSAASAACITLATAYVTCTKIRILPSERPQTVAAMAWAEKNTPPRSIVWAWWDHGYHIQYWARRPTISDGGIHGGERTVANALPYAMENIETAADWIRFYALRGAPGIRAFMAKNDLSPPKAYGLILQLLAEGPEKCGGMAQEKHLDLPDSYKNWKEFLFPISSTSTYLLVDELLARTAYWWYWFGTWNAATHTGRHSYYQLIPRITFRTGARGFQYGNPVDLRRGRLFLREGTVLLKRIRVLKNGTLITHSYPVRTGWFLDIREKVGIGALSNDPKLLDTLFHRLYFLHQTDLPRFRLVYEKPFAVQLWNVLPR